MLAFLGPTVSPEDCLMRSMLLGLFVGLSFAAMSVSAFACDYQTNASNDQTPPQHSAQAQTDSSSQ
jgi:hypothetical protein